jgi:hypothetical protein
MKVHLSAAYAPTQWTAVKLDVVEVDPGSCWDPKGFLYRVPAPGLYFAYGKCAFGGLGGNINATVISAVWKNGAATLAGSGMQSPRQAQTTSDGNIETAVADYIQCAAGDFLQLIAYSAAAWALTAGLLNTYLSILKVG